MPASEPGTFLVSIHFLSQQPWTTRWLFPAQHKHQSKHWDNRPFWTVCFSWCKTSSAFKIVFKVLELFASHGLSSESPRGRKIAFESFKPNSWKRFENIFQRGSEPRESELLAIMTSAKAGQWRHRLSEAAALFIIFEFLLNCHHCCQTAKKVAVGDTKRLIRAWHCATIPPANTHHFRK